MASDRFLFNPNVNTAIIQALEITPEAWIFIKHFVSKVTKRDKITVFGYLGLFIEKGVLTRRYMGKLVVYDYFSELTAQPANKSLNLRGFIREYEMEEAIKRTKD